MAHEGYHEAEDKLSQETKDLHRAIVSLQEELEAVDWYQQRIDATSDPDLKAVLGHNRDEEIEHAAMVLEWIRRRHPGFDRELRDWLFTDRPLTKEEEAGEPKTGPALEGAAAAGAAAGAPPPVATKLTVASLRGQRQS